MLIRSVSVKNWGVFADTSTLVFTPTNPEAGGPRHVTLIRGHNGAGKSTLFRLLPLLLHGPVALGSRTSREAYHSHITGSLHRSGQRHSGHSIENASAKIELELVLSGLPHAILVERQWRRAGSRVHERLDVLMDGVTPGIPEEDRNAWLGQLVPSGITALCFLDAERLDSLALPGQREDSLRDLVYRMAGLDLVERAREDLQYLMRHNGGNGRTELLQHEAQVQQSALDAILGETAELQHRLILLQHDMMENEREEAGLGDRLVAEGGSYAARRSSLKLSLEETQGKIDTVSAELRELCAGLLPFALAPELCDSLTGQLEHEERLMIRQTLAIETDRKLSQLIDRVRDGSLWESTHADPDVVSTVSRRLERLLSEAMGAEEPQERPIVHDLSRSDRAKVLQWMTSAQTSVADKALHLSERLSALREERSRVEQELARAPEDEVLAPIHAELVRIAAIRVELASELQSLQEKIAVQSYREDEQMKRLRQASDRLASAQARQTEMRLAEASRRALGIFRQELTTQRLKQLERQLVRCFNTICRKEHLLKNVTIDPKSFELRLFSSGGIHLRQDDFSAAESQLFTMSLFWALRRTSGLELPLAIDTPFARLDEHHRTELVRKFFPVVSNQVLLFGTDMELDSSLVEQLRPQCARIYDLVFHPANGSTTVSLAHPY